MTHSPDSIVREVLARRGKMTSADALLAETPLVHVVDSLGLIVVILDLEAAFGESVLDVTRVGALETVGDLLEAVREGAPQ